MESGGNFHEHARETITPSRSPKGSDAGPADEKNGKLGFNGVVKSEDEKNQIWNAIKTGVSSWQSDVVAGHSASRRRLAAPAAARRSSSTSRRDTYHLVKAGDSLSVDRPGSTSATRVPLHPGQLQRHRRHPDRSGQVIKPGMAVLRNSPRRD